MSSFTRARLMAGVVTSLLSLVVLANKGLAADANSDQAIVMEGQVRDALGALLGPVVRLGNRPMQVTASGDHYDIVVPNLIGGAHVSLTGTARLGDNDVWIVQDVKVTSPWHVTVDMPLPSQGSHAVRPGSSAAVTYTVEYQGQDGRIVWDPSFATPSTWTTRIQQSKVHAETADTSHDILVGPTSAVTTLRPSGPDRVDVLLDATMQDYRVVSPSGNDVAMQAARVSGAVNGINRTRGLAFIQSLTSITAAAWQAPAVSGGMQKIAPDLIRTILSTLQDLASDFSIDEALDGFIVNVQAQTMAIDHLRMGVNARSDAGLLRGGATIGIEGLGFPKSQLGDLAALLPRRIELRPVLGGLAVTDLLHLATLLSEGHPVEPNDLAALFSHGGITGGLESFTVEVGDATFTGAGQFVMAGTTADLVTGTAQLTANNFDALMQKMIGLPQFAPQVVPFMAFIKGIGRAVDNKLIWTISYIDGKILINDVDLTAMTKGDAVAAPRPNGPERRQLPGSTSPGSKKPLEHGLAPGGIPSWGR